MQFPAAASLVVYTGYNAATGNETIVSDPRTFSTVNVSGSPSLPFLVTFTNKKICHLSVCRVKLQVCC